MTQECYYMCDGCGEWFSTEESLEVAYEQRHPNNEMAVTKRHYCEECEVPDDDDIRTEY